LKGGGGGGTTERKGTPLEFRGDDEASPVEFRGDEASVASPIVVVVDGGLWSGRQE
jgi:hypothetical protein